MIPRTLQKKILQVAQQIPIITLIGPRQSGKTTLAKHLFASHTYINLVTLPPKIGPLKSRGSC